MYRPQASSVTESLKITVGVSLQALLIGMHHLDWDLQLPQLPTYHPIHDHREDKQLLDVST